MNIIFDLDGTLIDSSPSILSSVRFAFEQLKIPLHQPLHKNLIGPPLHILLETLSGEMGAEVVNSLSACFKQNYDSEGYKASEVFDGIDALLEQLSDGDYKLFIATNKRQTPTKKIIRYLGWQHYFHGVYSLDSFPGLTEKAQLLEKLTQEHSLKITDCIYIGDMNSDYEAAKSNNMRFVMVKWGYEKRLLKSYKTVDETTYLAELILAATNMNDDDIVIK